MNEREKSLAGVLPPVPTPFNPGGEVHHPALTANLERLNSYGLAGYVILGSNGETVYLAHDEKIALLETARKAIPPNKWMIAGTGCESTRATIELTGQAAEIGADAALIITPHFYGGKMTDEALTRPYFPVADAAPISIWALKPLLAWLNIPTSSASKTAAEISQKLPIWCG